MKAKMYIAGAILVSTSFIAAILSFLFFDDLPETFQPLCKYILGTTSIIGGVLLFKSKSIQEESSPD